VKTGNRVCVDCGASSGHMIRCEPCWEKAQAHAVVIVAVGASVTVSRRERIAIAVLAPVDADALFVCGALCDHGSECLLLRGHIPQDRHETQHGCVFFDPALTGGES